MSEPQNPEFRNNLEIFHPCRNLFLWLTGPPTLTPTKVFDCSDIQCVLEGFKSIYNSKILPNVGP